MAEFDTVARDIVKAFADAQGNGPVVPSPLLRVLERRIIGAIAAAYADGVAAELARAVKIIQAGCRRENHHGWRRETCPICRDIIAALRDAPGGW